MDKFKFLGFFHYAFMKFLVCLWRSVLDEVLHVQQLSDEATEFFPVYEKLSYSISTQVCQVLMLRVFMQSTQTMMEQGYFSAGIMLKMWKTIH